MKGLQEYLEASSLDALTPIRVLNIDGHEVAWMKYEGKVVYDITGEGREGEPFEGYKLYCECDFVFEVKDGHMVSTMDKYHCCYKAAVKHLRMLELRAEYDKMSNGLVRGGALGMFGDRKAPEDYTLDILRRHIASEWMATDDSGLLYLQTVGEILNIHEHSMWKLIDRLEDEHKLNRNQAQLFPYSPHPEPGGDPSDEYGTTEEDGWRIVAFGPANRYERQEWLLKVYKEDAEVMTASAPIVYEHRFGYDASDINTLEAKTQEVLDELKAAS